MIDYLRKILAGQFEAALAMLHNCIVHCPAEHWEAKIASLSLRQVAYHTLFFTEYYLSPGEEAFSLRKLHERGGDERLSEASAGLSLEETLDFLRFCRAKALETFAGETEQSLQAPARFARRDFSRGELHLYSLRHIQHHTGQLSAAIRRLNPDVQNSPDLPWIGSGWRDANGKQ